jgi:hypothetical protein
MSHKLLSETTLCGHPFLTSQGSAYHRFRRALDRRNVTEALSPAYELEHVGLSEASELCPLLTKEPARFRESCASLAWTLLPGSKRRDVR